MHDDSILVLIILLVAVVSFGLGRLSNLETQRPAVGLIQRPEIDIPPHIIGGKFVASKQGSRYHFPWCSGAQTIKDSNKIWFNTIEAAQAAGYTAAGNCKGLE